MDSRTANSVVTTKEPPMRSSFAGLDLIIPKEWLDITADLPEGSPPTLAKETGIGVIQFSVAKYQSGATPSITQKDLDGIFGKFCRDNSMRSVIAFPPMQGRVLRAGGTSSTRREFIAMWFLSDGRDVVMVTYTCLQAQDPIKEAELAQAAELVNSIRLGG